MQSSQSLLSPKLRRQESINNGRRIFLVGCFMFFLFAVLSLYYFTAFNSNFRSYVSSGHAQITAAMRSVSAGNRKMGGSVLVDEDDDSAPLPRLKPKYSSDDGDTSSTTVAETDFNLELTKEKDAVTDSVTQQDQSQNGAPSASLKPSSKADTEMKATLTEEKEAESDTSLPTQTEESKEEAVKVEEEEKKKESKREEEETEKETSVKKDSGDDDDEEKSEKKKKKKSDDDDDAKEEKEENKSKDGDESEEKKKKKKKKKSEDEPENEPTDGKDIEEYPICDPELVDVIPCLDHKIHKKMKLKLNTGLMEHYERHCPTSKFRLRCLIPPPSGYKTPIRWPKSRDWVWTANVPHTFLATEKSDQHWMVVEGEKINFPGGGTHFHNGADKYIEGLGKMLGNADGDLSLGGKIRTVLDIGCGVASFGGFLLAQNIIAMSVAPNDIHQNQIQFALERGIPAWLGVLGTSRLPYPSKSFDLAHCSRCRIDWAQRDGVLLIELDRLLRPGGYWAWSAPPAYRDDEESKRLWKEVTDVTNRLCWTIAAHEGQTVIFQKPTDSKCYRTRAEGTDPPMCSGEDKKPDMAWYTQLGTCINPMPDEDHIKVAPWPKRLTAIPPRLEEVGVEESAYKTDSKVWKSRVDTYWELLGSKVEDDSIRNVMDMNANLGGFGAALNDKPVWVMNVVPQESPTLRIIYDRGMLGVYHNWCEEFSTYPRTYDLLHAWQVLSAVDKSGCSIDDFLLEADRIVRPESFVIFRDKSSMIKHVTERVAALRWEVVVKADAEEDKLSGDKKEKILIVRKKLWEGPKTEKSVE